GDTLLDFGKVDIPSLFEAGAKLAYEYLKGLGASLPSFPRYHRRQLWAIRWNYFKSRFTRREFNSLDILGKLSVRMGNNLTSEQMIELAWLWYEPLSRCAVVEDGLIETLRQFRDDGLTLGVISNTFIPGEVIDRHLASEDLLELLPIRVYSCDARFRKPSPDIFRIALQRAELTAPEAIFVGDSLRADINGANSAGMISVLKDPTGKYDDAPIGANHRIRSIAELGAIVAEYNRDA
ncbi:MAG: HAD family hydrolase, partial [Planctomycetota bacterium]